LQAIGASIHSLAVESPTPLLLDGQPITPAEVAEVAERGRAVAIGEAARAQMVAGRAVVQGALDRGDEVYGMTTGVGALKRVHVAREDQARFNRRLVRTHATGTGPPASARVVRATMVVRLQGFAQGRSGVRPEVADAYAAALNAGFCPTVHTVGALGQSDLLPCAEIARALMGEGPDAAAFAAAGLEPVVPAAKDAIAMYSANAFSVGWACLALERAARALDAFDLAAALSYEALLANPTAIDPEVAEVRPYAGLRTTIERLRKLLEGGEILAGSLARSLQDPLCVRVVPQTHGAARDAFGHACAQLEIELRSSGDNPFVSLAQGRLLSAGNFDSTSYAAALDYARIAFAHAATIGVGRVQKLLSGRHSGLPSGLRERDDVPDDALVMLGYSATAAGAELRLLAAPVTLEQPTTSIDDGIDDRIVLAPLAARRLDEMSTLALHVAAAELVCAAQAVDLRGRSGNLGSGTGRIHALVREHVCLMRAGDDIPDDLAPLEARLAAGFPA